SPVTRHSSLPHEFEIRGEIFMSRKTFDRINKEIEAQLAEDGYDEEEIKERLLKNPRNAASGTIKMQDSTVVAKRKLDCFLYSIIADDLKVKSHYESLQKMKQWGFKISDHAKLCKDMDGVFEYISYWDKART